MSVSGCSPEFLRRTGRYTTPAPRLWGVHPSSFADPTGLQQQASGYHPCMDLYAMLVSSRAKDGVNAIITPCKTIYCGRSLPSAILPLCYRGNIAQRSSLRPTTSEQALTYPRWWKLWLVLPTHRLLHTAALLQIGLDLFAGPQNDLETGPKGRHSGNEACILQAHCRAVTRMPFASVGRRYAKIAAV